MTIIYEISDMQSRNVTENTCMKVVCLPYNNISVEIGYNKSFKWMSYILFVCLFTYQYLSLDGSRFKKNDKTLTLVKTHFMS